MAITKNDLVITISMLVALIFVNIVIVEAELANDQIQEDEIPELNLSSNRFDLVGEKPREPLGPKQFRVAFDLNDTARVTQVNSTTKVSAETSPPGCSYALKDENNLILEDKSLDKNGSTMALTYGEWKVQMTLENNQTCLARGTILESPGGASGFLSGFLGSTAEAIQGVWSSITYFASVGLWIIAVIIETTVSVGALLFDVAAFGIGFLGWAFGTYVALTSAAGSWASLALTVPVVGLSVMFVKIGTSLISSSSWI